MNMRPDDFDKFEEETIQESGDMMELLRTERAACPPLEVLRAAGAGALAEKLQSEVTTHLAACRPCQVLQADLGGLAATDATPQEVERILVRLRPEAGRTKDSRLWRLRLFSWRTAFAGIGLVLCAGLILWQFARLRLPGPPAPSVVEVKPATPQRVPEALRLEKPAVKMTLGVLVWRGTNQGRDQFLKDLAPAFDAYRADNFVAAASDFEALSLRYPESVEVFFYLGVSRLFLTEFTAANRALEQAARLADDSFAADVLWYLSLSCYRSGQTGKAQGYLERLCGASSGYAARACEALKELKSPSASPSR